MTRDCSFVLWQGFPAASSRTWLVANAGDSARCSRARVWTIPAQRALVPSTATVDDPAHDHTTRRVVGVGVAGNCDAGVRDEQSGEQHRDGHYHVVSRW
jgi:hypothetical protein